MLNMNFDAPVTVDTVAMEWIPSPAPGVWRKPLAREEAERGHATSIVRYEAGAAFSSHGHPKGEEILVLEGIFSDHTGDYGPGTYFRNPEGFSHAPFSREGCEILVKLHQFQADDLTHITVATDRSEWSSLQDGAELLELHKHHAERVFLLRCSAATMFHFAADKGLEIYVIKGVLSDEGIQYPTGSWLRRPVVNKDFMLSENTVIWIKQDHLCV